MESFSLGAVSMDPGSTYEDNGVVWGIPTLIPRKLWEYEEDASRVGQYSNGWVSPQIVISQTWYINFKH